MFYLTDVKGFLLNSFQSSSFPSRQAITIMIRIHCPAMSPQNDVSTYNLIKSHKCIYIFFKKGILANKENFHFKLGVETPTSWRTPCDRSLSS